jgi:ketosteroid isomerase-like protein
MIAESRREEAATAMRQINQAWLKGQVEDIASMVHPEIVMVFPNFSGRAQGREEFLAGFRDFLQNATIQEFREHDQQVDVAGDTAVDEAAEHSVRGFLSTISKKQKLKVASEKNEAGERVYTVKE